MYLSKKVSILKFIFLQKKVRDQLRDAKLFLNGILTIIGKMNFLRPFIMVKCQLPHCFQDQYNGSLSLDSSLVIKTCLFDKKYGKHFCCFFYLVPRMAKMMVKLQLPYNLGTCAPIIMVPYTWRVPRSLGLAYSTKNEEAAAVIVYLVPKMPIVRPFLILTNV